MEVNNTWYVVTDECDYCEKVTDCRWMYNGDVPVLAICKGCDEETLNFMNTTTKENAMNTTTTMLICDALTNKGCNNNGAFTLEALVSGNVARKSLTDDLVGGNWTMMELHVCRTHLNLLNKGKAINLKSGVNTLVSYDLTDPEQRNLFTTEVLGQEPTTKEEDTMSTNYNTMSIEELEELAADLFQEGAEIHQNRSAYETDQEWQELLDLTTAELTAVEEAIKNKKESVMTTKKILCGHCKGHHSTPAEVAACYGVERKADSRTQSYKPLVQITEGYARQWFETKKEAIAHLKGVGDVKKGMEPAKNGHGAWAWWVRS